MIKVTIENEDTGMVQVVRGDALYGCIMERTAVPDEEVDSAAKEGVHAQSFIVQGGDAIPIMVYPEVMATSVSKTLTEICRRNDDAQMAPILIGYALNVLEDQGRALMDELEGVPERKETESYGN